jgi:hypothetical protein
MFGIRPSRVYLSVSTELDLELELDGSITGTYGPCP